MVTPPIFAPRGFFPPKPCTRRAPLFALAIMVDRDFDQRARLDTTRPRHWHWPQCGQHTVVTVGDHGTILQSAPLELSPARLTVSGGHQSVPLQIFLLAP